jgi:hypothetical protein
VERKAESRLKATSIWRLRKIFNVVGTNFIYVNHTICFSVGDGVDEKLLTRQGKILFSSSWPFSVLLDCHGMDLKQKGKERKNQGNYMGWVTILRAPI